MIAILDDGKRKETRSISSPEKYIIRARKCDVSKAVRVEMSFKPSDYEKNNEIFELIGRQGNYLYYTKRSS